MAHLKPNNFFISKELYAEKNWRYGGIPFGYISLMNVARWKTRNGICLKIRTKEGSYINFTTVSCSSSPSSGVDQVELDEKYENKTGQFGNLLNEYGWQVRRMIENEDEMRKVAQVQAEAFYEPLIFFNHLFFQFFQAEVLQGLIYRLRNSAADRYACLVAESSNEAPENSIVGVVDVTFLRDDDVLQHLPAGENEYLYVSGIAVLTKFRRRKVATALLKACDVLSVVWGATYLVLRAYEDDLGARTLYTNAGYTVVSRDPPWTSTWIARKRRVLMIKPCT